VKPNRTFTSCPGKSWRSAFVVPVTTALLSLFMATGAAAQEVIAYDMVGSSSQNLISYTNAYTNAFSSAGDGFQKYQRGVSSSIPFSVLDDSLSIFPADSLGIIREDNVDEFFGITDTVNGDTSGPVSASWAFDISGAEGLQVSIDMGAMGDFESSDVFTWTYSIDGGPAATLFTNSVDEAGSQTYTLAGGTSFTLNDPMLVDGVLLNNVLQTLTADIAESGSTLTLNLTASTDGGSEAFVFQNIVISQTSPEPVAFDLVGSGSLNLAAFTNPFDGAFSSAGDGFQVYQRFVSPSIPFSVLDDSLSIFPPDSLGIIKEGNTDTFFGIVDTENADNSGPVSATWQFTVNGTSNLALSIDMGAMGDFESSDFFEWTYSFDGGPISTAFASNVDEAGSHTYTLEGGAAFTLNDPMLVDGTVLTNDLATFTAPLIGSGTTLTLTLTAQFNGGSEAAVFQNIVIGGSGGVEPPPPPPILEIWEIQGAGEASPYDGDIVESQDNIVTALADNGFFMQTPATRSDADVNTSDGIFVFTDTAPTVSVGDGVNVLGTIDEFFGFTEFTNVTDVTVVSSGGMLPDAVIFDATVPSPDPNAPSCAIEFECYEGMLVSINGGTVAGPNQRFNSDPVAEIYITAAGQRPFREPGIDWDGNPEIFELDADKLGLDNPLIPAGSSFDATGVLGFEFGGYELWPTALNVTPAVLPQPVRMRDRAEFTVGSLNLLRLFEGDADKAAKLAAYVVEVLDAPDVLAVQEVGTLGALDELAAAVSGAYPGVDYVAYLEEGNDLGGIDVGFLARDSVAVDAITQIGKDEIFAFDGSPLHDRPPLLLEGRSIDDGAPYPFAVMVVHNRSLNGIETERVQLKRLAQAESIAAAVQALQDADPGIRLIVTGDFNAFEFSDGYVHVVGEIADGVTPALINQVLAIDAEDRYSFIFRGSAQTLDHALTSSALDLSIRGFAFGRGNADAAVDLINDPGSLLRASDHDGLVLFITKDLDGDGVNDDADVCPGTLLPETLHGELGKNRFALMDDDFAFDTDAPNGKGPGRAYSTVDTAGCSCNQIIAAQGLGKGHSRFGCSIGVMDNWVKSVQ
jgi:hypothetical protein